jgi:hypothetical protein
MNFYHSKRHRVNSLAATSLWRKIFNNVWPNNVYKDSGTWLCPKQDTDVIIYRADVTPIHRKNTKHEKCN